MDRIRSLPSALIICRSISIDASGHIPTKRRQVARIEEKVAPLARLEARLDQMVAGAALTPGEPGPPARIEAKVDQLLALQASYSCFSK